jgi:copper chaperone CopZ
MHLQRAVAAVDICSYIMTMSDKHAILDVNGANCASCAYAIEHLGRKIQGVEDVKVDAANQEIHVRYGGNPGSLERISEVVRRLGYEARVRWESVS